MKGVGAAGAGLVAGAVGSGAGLAGVAAGDVGPVAPRRYAAGGGGAPSWSVDFGCIFPKLAPFAEADDRVRSALLEVGQQGGILDAQDDLAAGAKALIVDPSVNGNPTSTNPYGTNPDNPTMTAGTPTPALDLDSVFGGGPGLRPDLYVDNPDGTVGQKPKIGSVVGSGGAVHEDVPRVANGDGSYGALLRNPRNDEHVMIGGLQCAHILFYNRVQMTCPSSISRVSRPRGRKIDRIVAGALLSAGGIYYLSRIPLHGSFLPDVLPGLVIMALGFGGVFVGVTTAANAGVAAEEAGLAAGLLSTSQQLGMALGLAILSAIATARPHAELAAHASRPEALTSGYQRALLLCSIFVLVAALIASRTPERPRYRATARHSHGDGAQALRPVTIECRVGSEGKVGRGRTAGRGR